MDAISGFFLDVLYYSYIKPHAAQRLGLALLLVLAVLLIYLTRRTARGSQPKLRELSAVVGLEASLGEGAPVGAKLHLGTGRAGLADSHAVETLVGIQAFGHLIKQAAAVGVPVIATAGDITTLPALENTALSGFEDTGNAALLRVDTTRFVAQDPVAYAAGVMRILNSEEVTTNVMLGSFGDEYLLMGETAAQRGIDQVVGSANPFVLPFAYATSKALLIGEEMFALAAYLQRRPTQLAGVVAQDWLRLIAVVATVLLALAASLGFVIT